MCWVTHELEDQGALPAMQRASPVIVTEPRQENSLSEMLQSFSTGSPRIDKLEVD
jgi:hypothetical protein